MRTYAVSRGDFLIEEVTFCFPLVVDVYGHEYEVLVPFVRIEVRVRESNDAGSLKHQANKIYQRLVWGLGRVDLHGQSWKIMLKNEEVILRSIGVRDVIDFYDKRKWPLFGTSVKGVISNEYYECATLTV